MMEVLGGSIDALTDDNLDDILVRLDAVSVLRCRAVCKSWRRISTDRSFLAAHAAARPREMIIKTKYGYARSTVPLAPPDDDIDTTTLTTAGDGDGDGHHRYLFDPRPPPADGEGMSSEFLLYASLDGLLVLEHWRRSGPSPYVICNPVTRQWANLPSPVPRCRGARDICFDTACGFYLHASSGEYRLLVHCVIGPSCRVRDLERYCCILSAGSALPRRLPHAPTMDPKRMFPSYENPVCYRGTLHWLAEHPEGSSTGKMLAFDTVSETFRLMPRPPPEGPEVMSDLLELDGELSVTTIFRDGINGAMLDIWALEDYDAEKWTLRHRLKVLRPPRLSGGGWKHPIIMTMGDAHAPCGSSAILVGFPQTSAVMVYSLNKDNKVRKRIDFGGFVSSRVFSESLVPHAFFDSHAFSDSPGTVPPNFSNPLFNGSRGKSAYIYI